jgi:signal transduction histidine kinase
MAGTGSSPVGPRPVPVLAWLVPAAVVAASAATAVWTVTAAARFSVAVCGAIATGAVGIVSAEAARRGRAVRKLRRRFAEREAATVRVASELLPEAVARLQRGDFAEDVLSAVSYGHGLSQELQAAHKAVLAAVVSAVQAEEDLRDSAQRAFVNIARRVQAIVHQQSSDLREMEERHGHEPDIFGDLLRLDHGTALIGRLADSIAVLGGARPGRQWSKPVPLFSVLRGAMSRILDYQRVELHSVSEVAVAGPAVEPLIHALAELLDNATRYSPPQTRVHLTAVEVQAGIAVEIEDGGVSLSEEARERAERMLMQAQAGIDLKDLGETPRLGLAVAGRLAQAYNFQISLRPSAYGGVRAVLIVPQDLLTTSPTSGAAHGIASYGPWPGATALRPAAPVPGSRPAAGMSPLTMTDEVPFTTERTPGGLPQRRRRATAPAAQQPAAPVPQPGPAAPAPPAEEGTVQPGIWLAAFHSGLSGEQPPTAPAWQSRDDTSGKGEQP